MLRVLIFALLVAFSGIALVQAQDDDICTEQVQAALSFTEDACEGIGRNQVCYGNQLLRARLIESAPSLDFDAPGDLADLVYIDSLQLSQLIAPDEWGVALLQIQANLPATLPGQNVVMLLFGDVEIDNAGSELPPRLTGTITANANLRSGPGTSFAILGAGTNGAEVEVEGRNADNSWFRFLREDGETAAWIFADLIEIDGEVETLPVLDADGTAGTRFGPMQAFYFRSALSGTRCVGLPRDGILVQTPGRQGEIQLQANEVDIRLGSTAFLQAVPGEFMTVDLLEGQGSVTASGTTIFLPAGARAEIPLDADGAASGPPVLTTYTDDDVAYLPVGNLPLAVEIAAPLDESALSVENIEDDWVWTENMAGYFCGNASGRVEAEDFGDGSVFRVERRANGLQYTLLSNGFSAELEQTSPGVYSRTFEPQTSSAGTATFSVQIEWTSAFGGVWTSINDYEYIYCNETIERSVNFVRAENPDSDSN